MTGLAETADYAVQKFVDLEEERCAWCARLLPRYYLDGTEQKVWVDEELGGVWCQGCYWRWKEKITSVSEKILEGVDPFVAQVIRALIRVGGQLDITEDQHRHRVIGTLDVDEYERTPIWKKRRNEFVASKGPNPRCELCLSANEWTGTEHVPIKINVHHRTYERTACELDEDLALLCRTCHLVIHQPSRKESQAQFQRLLRDRDEKAVVEAIGALLPKYGWGPLAE